MRAVLAVAYSGVGSVLRHPLRSAVTSACLAIVLVPYLVGIGISQALQRQARMSLEAGADLYVSGIEFGRHASVPVRLAAALRQWDGVESVTPRVVGAISLGSRQEPAVLVGLPRDFLPPDVRCIEGRWFRGGDAAEIIVGSELARRLRLHVGDALPPFYRNAEGERVTQVVGVFQADLPLWQARLIFTSLDYAQHIFDQPGRATELLVDCRPGYAPRVAERMRKWGLGALHADEPAPDSMGVHRLRVVGRDELAALLPRRLLHREGIFNLHFVLLLIVGVFVLFLTSGVGLEERRREVGILKATGWQTDEVLLRSLIESLLLGLLAAASSLLLAYAWLRWLNGFWIASLFLAGVSIRPGFLVPYQLSGTAVLLAGILALFMILSGTLYAAWRAATIAPREALQ